MLIQAGLCWLMLVLVGLIWCNADSAGLAGGPTYGAGKAGSAAWFDGFVSLKMSNKSKMISSFNGTVNNNL